MYNKAYISKNPARWAYAQAFRSARFAKRDRLSAHQVWGEAVDTAARVAVAVGVPFNPRRIADAAVYAAGLE
jgi:hypothetical protein